MHPPRHALLFILVTIVIDAIGIGLIFPLMPDLMARVGAGDAASGALGAGVLMSAYAAMQFLFAPIVGGLSDAYGRKPVLIVALASLAVDYTIMALASSFWILLLGRMLAGVAGATYITATAYIADITPPSERAARFGLIGATFGLGFVMGPALGGVLAAWDLSLPFWTAAGFSAANVLLGLAVLPESLARARRRPFTRADLNPFGAIRDALRLPGLGLPLVLLFTFEFANMVYPTLWSFWSRASFGWSAAMIGASFAVYGVGVALAQGVALPLLVKRLGEGHTLMLGMGGALFAFFAFGVTGVGWVVFLLIPVACLADIVPPTMTAMMSASVAEDRQGLLQGVIASLGSVAAIIAPLLLTPLFRAFATPGQELYWPGMPFLAGGLLLAVTMPWFLRLGRRRAAPT